MTVTLISSIVTIAIGLIYSFMTFSLPNATIGRALEPKIFPAILGISLTILGFILMVSELIKTSKTSGEEKEKRKAKINFDKNTIKIISTIVNCFLYAILFTRIGYIFSTFIFLEAELFIFGGKEKLKLYTLVAVLFSITAYVIFNILLGIYLPKSPLGIF